MTQLRRVLLVSALCALIALGGGRSAGAQMDISSLFHNTGQGLSQGDVDPNYTVAYSGSVASVLAALNVGVGAPTYVVNQSGFPIGTGNWFAGDTSTSQWIAPQSTYEPPGSDPNPGYYGFRTTFDLGAINPSLVALAGQWSSDNNGVEIFLNGNALGFSTPADAFTGFHDFAVDAGSSFFVNGVNTLDFVVYNIAQTSSNPSGLRVEMTGTVIPEPAFYQMGALLLGSGILFNPFRRRRLAV